METLWLVVLVAALSQCQAGEKDTFTREDVERMIQDAVQQCHQNTNKLNDAINTLTADYDKRISTLTAGHNECINALKSDFNERIDTLTQQVARLQTVYAPPADDSTAEKRLVLNGEVDIERTVVKLEQQIKALQTSSGSGATYTRWGRTTCPGNGTDLVYAGYAAGTYYTSKGGGSNYLCLPSDPIFGSYVSGHQDGADLYGAEYQYGGGYTASTFAQFFSSVRNDDDVPCAVCRSTRPSSLMIPARNACYPGWSKEYSGYLVGEYSGYDSSEFICMDGAPQAIPHGGENKNGALFYVAEANCGSLACPPYEDGKELTCVVCTK